MLQNFKHIGRSLVIHSEDTLIIYLLTNNISKEGFKDLFFENERLSLDNQKAIIDYFFEKFSTSITIC
mgnify:CR=1 FL=1